MMKPTHYHMAFGLFHAVTIGYMEEDGTLDMNYTSDGIKVTSIELFPLSDLIGKRVRLKGTNHYGTVKGFLSDNNDWCCQRYLGDGLYGLPKPLQSYNSQVAVYWTDLDSDNGMPYYWNTYNSLEFIE